MPIAKQIHQAASSTPTNIKRIAELHSTSGQAQDSQRPRTASENRYAITPARKHGTYLTRYPCPACRQRKTNPVIGSQARATVQGDCNLLASKNRYICISKGRLQSGPGIEGLLVRFCVRRRLERMSNLPTSGQCKLQGVPARGSLINVMTVTTKTLSG